MLDNVVAVDVAAGGKVAVGEGVVSSVGTVGNN